jgi:hypothetical protein
LTVRRVLVALAVGAAFVVGIGLGEALHDRPDLSGTQTILHTLTGLPARSIATETGSVTGSRP